MKPEAIARVAHEINRAYCASLGDDTQVAWEDAEDWQKQSVLAGVDMHLANPDASPADSHESWLKQKLDDGWVYGEVKDVEAKAHPCCVPYDELPQEQKSKDYLFKAVVAALKDIPDAEQAVIEALANVPSGQEPSSGVRVKYIGRRDVWRDTLYSTKLTFVKGQTRGLPHEIANKLLRHSDLFVIDKSNAPKGAPKPADKDDTAALLQQPSKKEKDREEERVAFDVIDQIGRINNKKSLAEFAERRLQLTLEVGPRTTMNEMRQQITQHIERFGV